MRFRGLSVDLFRDTLKKTPFVTSAAFALFVSGCGGASSKPAPATPAKPATTAEAAAGTPTDLSPNVAKDRRTDAGVRAPAKPLVLGKEKSAKCGKIAAP